MPTPNEILKKYWGFNQFREPQEEIINNVLSGKDSVVLLPTSGGKSICYQIPTLILNGLCVVISPLIALIKDQVDSLNRKGIKAIALTSQLSENEVIIAFDNLRFGGYKFIYLSPEKLQSKFIQEKISQLNVSLIAIDEAHCISGWGHDFRPTYLKLKVLKELKPEAKIIALTATATQIVLEDIKKYLEIDDAVIFRKSFYRKNLSYSILKTEDIHGKLLLLLKKTNESVIIYTSTRRETKEISDFLNKNSHKSNFYHGGLSSSEKNNIFTSWINDEKPIMVATNAFGMGIDKPNVRLVIHINIPNSIENYIQEAGRAGRDGKESKAIILNNNTILKNFEKRFLNNLVDTKFVKTVYLALNQYYSIALGEIPKNSLAFSIQEFCNYSNLNILKTYNAIKVLSREDIISIDENYKRRSVAKFLINQEKLFDYLESFPSKREFVQLILRSYGGIFNNFVKINEHLISKKINWKKSKVIGELKELHANKIIQYEFANTNSKLFFLVIREDNYTINRISKNIEQQNILKLDKLKSCINYIKNNKICRNIQLMKYFDEKITEDCGKCDICISKKIKIIDKKNISFEILNSLKEIPKNSQEISFELDFLEQDIISSIKLLLGKGKIIITSQNKYKLKEK